MEPGTHVIHTTLGSGTIQETSPQFVVKFDTGVVVSVKLSDLQQVVND